MNIDINTSAKTSINTNIKKMNTTPNIKTNTRTRNDIHTNTNTNTTSNIRIKINAIIKCLKSLARGLTHDPIHSQEQEGAATPAPDHEVLDSDIPRFRDVEIPRF